MKKWILIFWAAVVLAVVVTSCSPEVTCPTYQAYGRVTARY